MPFLIAFLFSFFFHSAFSGKRVSYQGQPLEDTTSFSLPILNLVDITDQKSLSGLSFSMDYTQFNIALSFAVGADKRVKLYCLPDSQNIYENISEKEKVTEENFQQVIKKVHSAFSKSDLSSSRPTLFFFVIPPEIKAPVSLDQVWLGSNKPVQSKAPCSRSSRSSDDQTSSRTAAMARDGTFCLFCERSDLACLEAAHIFDVERYQVRMNIKQFGIISINEVNNFFILCKQCHYNYDHQMMCIEPKSRELVITEAFLACSPLKEQYSRLQRKSIHPPDDSVLLNHYPPVALLEFRWKLFIDSNNIRRLRSKEYPFYCVKCSKRWKTENGYKKHLCKDEATAHHLIGVNNYETPKKGDSTEKIQVGLMYLEVEEENYDDNDDIDEAFNEGVSQFYNLSC